MDETAVVLVIGGCKYDFPMGDCMDIDVDANDNIRGCAHEFETHMAGKVRRYMAFFFRCQSDLLA